jgi:hypothetical protein
MRAFIHVAQEVGEGLGRCEDLLGALQDGASQEKQKLRDHRILIGPHRYGRRTLFSQNTVKVLGFSDKLFER